MIMTNRLLPVALVAALIGGSVGALVMHTTNPSTAETKTATLDTAGNADASAAQVQANQTANDQFIPAEFDTVSEQGAYKTGFADGFGAAQGGVSAVGTAPVIADSQSGVVYRNTGRSVRSSQRARTVYYNNQQQPKGRSFWQKHRDKLTVAMGTGGGAVVGGLIGGKKGAVIGALGGGGGSALYTYKLRKKNRRY